MKTTQGKDAMRRPEGFGSSKHRGARVAVFNAKQRRKRKKRRKGGR